MRSINLWKLSDGHRSNQDGAGTSSRIHHGRSYILHDARRKANSGRLQGRKAGSPKRPGSIPHSDCLYGNPSHHLMSNGEFKSVNQEALAALTQPDVPLALIDYSPSPSVGVAAACALDLEPEKGRWRCVARDWYAAGLSDTPGKARCIITLELLRGRSASCVTIL